MQNSLINDFWIPHTVGDCEPIKQITKDIWEGIWKKKKIFIHIFLKTIFNDKFQFFNISFCIHTIKNLENLKFTKIVDVIEEPDYYYFITEKPKGIAISKYIEKNGPFSENQARKILIDLVEIYLKLKDLSYRKMFQITISNVYISKHFHVKNVSPYFFSNVLNDDDNDAMQEYNPPELFFGKYNDNKSEVWTCGVFLYYIVTGHMPFTKDIASDGKFSEEEDFERILLNEKLEVPSCISEQLSDLIKKMLAKNSFARISFDQILSHRWLAPNKKLEKAKHSISATSLDRLSIDQKSFKFSHSDAHFEKYDHDSLKIRKKSNSESPKPTTNIRLTPKKKFIILNPINNFKLM